MIEPIRETTKSRNPLTAATSPVVQDSRLLLGGWVYRAAATVGSDILVRHKAGFTLEYPVQVSAKTAGVVPAPAIAMAVRGQITDAIQPSSPIQPAASVI
jgi:hypothetical protein